MFLGKGKGSGALIACSGQHSRSAEAGHGKRMTPDCKCRYFVPYRHIEDEEAFH